MTREALVALLVETLLPELEGLEHGTARLEVHVRDGCPWRAVATRERSVILSATPTQGAGQSLKSSKSRGFPGKVVRNEKID